VPVSAFDGGLGDVISTEDEAALDAGASLAEDSIDIKRAGNSGLSLCLLIVGVTDIDGPDPM